MCPRAGTRPCRSPAWLRFSEPTACAKATARAGSWATAADKGAQNTKRKWTRRAGLRLATGMHGSASSAAMIACARHSRLGEFVLRVHEHADARLRTEAGETAHEAPERVLAGGLFRARVEGDERLGDALVASYYLQRKPDFSGTELHYIREIDHRLSRSAYFAGDRDGVGSHKLGDGRLKGRVMLRLILMSIDFEFLSQNIQK